MHGCAGLIAFATMALLNSMTLDPFSPAATGVATILPYRGEPAMVFGCSYVLFKPEQVN